MIRLFIASLIALPLLWNASAGAAETPKTIHITYVAAPFNLPAIVMRANGYLDQAFAARGISVDSPTITSGAAQIQAMAGGSIDIASVLGDTSAILGRANGLDLRAVSVFSRSPKAFVVMTRADGPASIAALKGHSVAGPKGTTLNQLLAAALAANGLRLGDVEYLNMDLSAARAALLAGRVDAATLAGIDALAVTEAGGRALATGEGLIAPTSVITVRGDFLRAHRDLVALYLAAHRRALDFITAHPEAALKIGAEAQKISVEDAKAMVVQYDFSPAITARDIANMQSTKAFMLQAGMLAEDRAIDIRRDLIDPETSVVP